MIDAMVLSRTPTNLCSVWQGLKRMAAVNLPISNNPVNIPGSTPASLLNDLNSFFSRFEINNSTQLEDIRSTLIPDDHNVPCISFLTTDVVMALERSKANSAPGADNISGRVLRHCADQLGTVFQELFQISNSTGTVPKHSTIIPIPKRSPPRALKDLRPVTLSSQVKKAMERLVKHHILTLTNSKLDPLQFAYQSHKSVDDAKAFIIDTIHRNLELPHSSTRLLFADFSSAFNTLQLHILAERLQRNFNLSSQLILWILDFLTNRTQ
ncbi:uncharacterized protein LOC125005237 [Mugil cephalus]|uniref:uncharacterized protein LOC125005237 n=1 Tax=Mugil cephalus TaxID=48193 RepID=UPI001FB6DBDC|nr:uncharacterized protein LOC125005237 [Mugil cephalus]